MSARSFIINEGANTRNFSITQDGEERTFTVNTGVGPAGADAVITNASIGAVLTAATAKTTPVDADTMPLTDSAASNALKKVTWANIKATLTSYFGTVYAALVHTHVSANITDSTSAATANKLVLRDATGGANFAAVGASSVTSSGAITTTGSNGFISTSGYDATITTTGSSAAISTIGSDAGISTSGSDASISTSGDIAYIQTTGSGGEIRTFGTDASIYTSGSNANIYTNGGGVIQTSSTFKFASGAGTTTLSGTQTTDRAIAFPNASGTVALTTSNVATATALATARNIFGLSFDGTANVSGDAVNSGHFASIPTGGQAGHFVTLNGTAPTVVAGRSAWYSDSSGNPSFRNGTGATENLIGTNDLGTGVATFLATPLSANLAAAVTDETGSGSLVFATSPTLTTPILGTPTSGTLTNCTGYPEQSLTGVLRAFATSDLVRASGVGANDSVLTVALASGKAYRIRGVVKIVSQTGGTLYSNLVGPNCTFENVLAVRYGFPYNFNAGSSNLTPYTSLGLHNQVGAGTQQLMFDGIINKIILVDSC